MKIKAHAILPLQRAPRSALSAFQINSISIIQIKNVIRAWQMLYSARNCKNYPFWCIYINVGTP